MKKLANKHEVSLVEQNFIDALFQWWVIALWGLGW